jgi:ribosomal protein L14E/L6E/L27E
MTTLRRGSAVVSLAGKDKDTLLVVLRAEGQAAYVADGRKRRVQSPKRKNPRHLRDTGAVLEEHSMATNREIRRALSRLAGSPLPQEPLPPGEP